VPPPVSPTPAPVTRATLTRATGWTIALVAAVPMLAVYAAHFLGAPAGTSATGFLQYDQPSYVGNAIAAAAAGPPFAYGLPWSPNPDTPVVYFQPFAAALGLFLAATGFDPGYVYAALGAVLAVVMYRTAIAVALAYVGDRLGRAAWPVLLAFLWGGGALVLGGIAKAWVGGQGLGDLAKAAFSIDPFDGLWSLNLGRNVYYTVEAFYHVVFLGAVWLVLSRRYGWALAAVAFESANHPFTGLELVLVVGGFAVLERLVLRRADPPLWFVGGAAAILAAHLGYYVVLLPRLSPEHALLVVQWLHPWTLSVTSMVFGYGPVGAVAAWAVARGYRGGSDAGRRRMRLALAWFVAAFALANHQVFVAPRQPLHFTHGYVWTPLMLLALPVVAGWFRSLLALPNPALRFSAVAGLLLLVALDNAAWFGWHIGMSARGRDTEALLLPDAERATLRRLAAPDMAGRLLLSDDDDLAYVAIVYDHMRAWVSHGDSSPDRARRQRELRMFFATGAELPAWRRRPLVVVYDGGDPAVVARLQAAGFGPPEHFGQCVLLIPVKPADGTGSADQGSAAEAPRPVAKRPPGFGAAPQTCQ